MLSNLSNAHLFHPPTAKQIDRIAWRTALIVGSLLSEAILATGLFVVAQYVLDVYRPEALVENIYISLAVLLGAAVLLLGVDIGAFLSWALRHFKRATPK